MAQRLSVVGAERSEASRAEVIALVASAGGLEAVTKVLRDLSVDTPAAVVVAQHLGGQGSTLVEILRRRVALPVDWAVDGGRIEAGSVTVAPPRSVLEVLPDGSCVVRASEGTLIERPLDALLASVGDSFGSRALGVVLTGMGTDGASGAAAIRAAGGVVIAQSEETAEQPAMPAAAAAAGAVDLVLPLHEIGSALVDAALGRPLPLDPAEALAIRATFGSQGVMASYAAELDWSRTPLGPVTSWSPELRTTVGLAMASRDPAAVFWGEAHLFLYNEEAIPIIGRETTALARPFRQAVPEVWEAAAPMFERAMAGESSRYTAVPFRYVSEGRLQVRWMDLSDSPIRGHDGTVAGIYRVFYERTDEVLAARRLEALDMLARAPRAGSRREALSHAIETLSDAADVVFAVAYLLDESATRAGLVAAAGAEEGGALAPRELRLAPGAAWPLHDLREPVVVDDLASRFPGHQVGADDLAPEAAWLYPLRDDAEDRVVGTLILGVDPYLNLDDRYREFLLLVGESVAGRMAEAHARQRERRRLERLAELDRAKTEFFSNVSHEFRTPLTLMLGPLEDLAHTSRSAARKADIELVRRNTHRLLRLVGTMLDFSQIEAGRLRARFAPVDLAELTQEIVAQFESAAARAGLELHVDLDDLPEPVWVDGEMWEKIVSNLLSNALKFTFAGAIEVTLRALPGHAELVVRDSGVGIPDEELRHIFKRFHRVRDTRARTYEGAGIGLALVNELVRRHHGRVRAASSPGEGTTMTVWIPLGRRPTAPDAPLPVPPPTGAVAAAMAEEAEQWGEAPDVFSLDDDGTVRLSLQQYARGARILVADDHNDMRAYLTRLLAPHWQIEAASDGARALDLARADPPDLVLADVMMPGLDGFALLRELRDDPALKSIPVVLVTARAGEESAIEGLLAGADDYIVKPFSARELVARVGGQLELARTRRHAAELNAFRIRLSDTLRSLSDPIEIQQTACRMLVEQIGADGARFVEIDEAANEFVTLGGHPVEGVPGGYARYPIAEYAPLAPMIRAGRRVVIEDTQHDPQVREVGAALATLQAGAQLVLPLPRNGAASATLVVHQRTPRRWADEEVALAEEVAGRAWAEVERVRAEAALRESEERARLALDAADMGSYVWYPDEDRTEADSRLLALFGLPADATITHAGAIAELVHPDDRARDHAAVLAALDPEGDGVFRDEIRVLHPGGGERWISTTGRVEFAGEPRRAVRLFGVAVDVTERKEREQRHAFLLRFSDALRPQRDQASIESMTVEMLAEHLQVDRCWLSQVYPEQGISTVRPEWVQPGMPPMSGTFQLSDYPETMRQLATEPMRVEDATSDPHFSGPERQLLARLRLQALLVAPLRAGPGNVI